MAPVKCFFLEDTKKNAISLRRYFHGDNKCPGRLSYHNADVKIGEEPDGGSAGNDHPHDDPRWPTKCDSCDYVFKVTDEWQRQLTSIYRRADTGEEMALSDAPVGAMWYADWYEWRLGPDGHHLEVIVPGGSVWSPDDRASNCTMKDDNIHRCWVRHGTPPNIHVDKNGVTCQAGAGSIMARTGWHGFLTNGVLQEQR